ARANAAQRTRAARFRRGRETVPVHFCDRSLPELLALCDLAVLDGGGPGPTADWEPSPWCGAVSVACAHAARVPVVAPIWATYGAPFTPELRAACGAHNSSLPELARLLIALADDAAGRKRLSALARDQAASGCSTPAFVSAAAQAWDDAAREGRGHA